MSTKRGAHCAAGRCYDCSGHLGCECDCHSETVTATSPADLDARIQAIERRPAAEEGLVDREREEFARDLLRSWADAASNAGCPPAFVDRMRTFADMHDRHATEAASTERHVHYIDGEVFWDPAVGPCVLATPVVATLVPQDGEE